MSRNRIAVAAGMLLAGATLSACGDLSGIDSRAPRHLTLPNPATSAAEASAGASMRREGALTFSIDRRGGRAQPARQQQRVTFLTRGKRVYAVLPGSVDHPAAGVQSGPGAGALLVEVPATEAPTVAPVVDRSWSERKQGKAVGHRLRSERLEATGPSWQLRAYTDGALVSTTDFIWRPVAGGWRLDHIRARSYDAAGAVNDDATLSFDAGAEVASRAAATAAPLAMHVPFAAGGTQVAGAVARGLDRACDVALGLLLPAELAAQTGSCTEHLKAALGGIGEMIVGAALDDPLTFFRGALTVAVSMYEYASCMEGR